MMDNIHVNYISVMSARILDPEGYLCQISIDMSQSRLVTYKKISVYLNWWES